jgi:hypothetical protein
MNIKTALRVTLSSWRRILAAAEQGDWKKANDIWEKARDSAFARYHYYICALCYVCKIHCLKCPIDEYKIPFCCDDRWHLTTLRVQEGEIRKSTALKRLRKIVKVLEEKYKEVSE